MRPCHQRPELLGRRVRERSPAPGRATCQAPAPHECARLLRALRTVFAPHGSGERTHSLSSSGMLGGRPILGHPIPPLPSARVCRGLVGEPGSHGKPPGGAGLPPPSPPPLPTLVVVWSRISVDLAAAQQAPGGSSTPPPPSLSSSPTSPPPNGGGRRHATHTGGEL